jgi:hypothetical protein
VRAVKIDAAERLAATAAEGLTITPSTVRAVVHEYLTTLVACPACDGTGTIRYGGRIRVQGVSESGTSEVTAFTKAGDTGDCLRCAGKRWDSDWVAWHCVHDVDEIGCRSNKGGEHNGCGWHLVLPLPIELKEGAVAG